MAWIESHQELREHPKVKRAARMLGTSKPQLVGHLHFLWWWALEYAEDGNLAGYTPADIADAAGWEGNPDELIHALVGCGVNGKAGFIEVKASGDMVLHDWNDCAGRLVEQRKAAVQRTRRWREANANVTHNERVPYGATVPNSTVPNTPPTPPKGPIRAADADAVVMKANAKETRTKPKGKNLAPLVDAFRALGLPGPVFTPAEARAAGLLLDHYTPAEIAECWQDIGDLGTPPYPRFGNDWLQQNRSFQALLAENRMGNWKAWKTGGKRPPPPNGKADLPGITPRVLN